MVFPNHGKPWSALKPVDVAPGQGTAAPASGEPFCEVAAVLVLTQKAAPGGSARWTPGRDAVPPLGVPEAAGLAFRISEEGLLASAELRPGPRCGLNKPQVPRQRA